MITYSRFTHHYTKSYFKHTEALSKDYKVFIGEEEIPVYTCRISRIPFNRIWPGHQRELDQTELASYVNIVSDEAVPLRVVFQNEKEGEAFVRPYSKGVKCEKTADGVAFTLEGEGQFVLGIGDLHNCLYIFNSKPIECPDPASVTHYFGPGVHMPGKIRLFDNESVYVDRDAIVFGCLYAEDAKNIRIFGNGVFDDSGEERFSRFGYEDFTNGNVKFYDCENISIEGVLFKNSAIWCINIFHCFDVTLDNIKVFGQWRYNTDGVDIVNSQNITVKNSFIHSFDDAVTIKGIDRYIATDNKNITTENCVLWCDWGKTLEIGLETACREYKNIVFRNCDIIRAGNTALDIQNGDCAEVSDILYEDIRVEYNSFDNQPVLQRGEDQVYDAYDKKFVPRLVSIENNRMRGDFYSEIPKEHAPLDLTGIRQACVHDVTVRGIDVYYDEKIEKRDGLYPTSIIINSMFDDVEYYNINISGIRINGVPVTAEDIVTDVKNTKDFVLE